MKKVVLIKKQVPDFRTELLYDGDYEWMIEPLTTKEKFFKKLPFVLLIIGNFLALVFLIQFFIRR